MGARQSNTKSEALITSGEALQLCVDPLSPAFLANTVMRSLILGGGTPTASMKRVCEILEQGVGLTQNEIVQITEVNPSLAIG